MYGSLKGEVVADDFWNQLLRRCIHNDPVDRPTATEALNILEMNVREMSTTLASNVLVVIESSCDC